MKIKKSHAHAGVIDGYRFESTGYEFVETGRFTINDLHVWTLDGQRLRLGGAHRGSFDTAAAMHEAIEEQVREFARKVTRRPASDNA
jgi:hypothetical protein